MPDPSFDNVGTASNSNVSSITSAAFVIGGVNRVSFVDVVEDDVRSVISVNVGGVGGSFVAKKVVGSGFENLETWMVINPPTGSQTATATFDTTNAGSCFITATNYQDAEQLTPLGTPATNNGNSTTPSVTVTSAIGELVHTSIWSRDTTGYAVTGGQTDRSSVGTGTALDKGSDIAGAASVTPAISQTNVAGWCAIGVSLKAVIIRPLAEEVSDEFNRAD